MNSRMFLPWILLVVVGCSSSTNINQLLVGNEQKDSYEYNMEQAQHFFDKGKFNDAHKFAAKAYALNPSNEETAILLGFIELGLAGVDSFSLAKNLMNESDGTSNKFAAALAENTDNSAFGSLNNLSGVIGLTDADKSALTTSEVDRDGTIIKGTSDLPFFTSIPVDLPVDVTTARASASDIVKHLNAAVHVICPFVNDEAKIRVDDEHTSDDPRHTEAECALTSAPRYGGGKAHFLWAFSHLTEAIAFNVIMNQTITEMNNRGTAIEQSKNANVSATDYVEGLGEMADIIDVILPTDEAYAAVSMLNGIFNDFEAASQGFAQIAGMPESITKSISAAMAKLRDSSSKISTTGKDKNATALRDQMTNALAKKVREEMTKRESTFSAQQKTDACNAYKKITTQAFDMCA